MAYEAAVPRFAEFTRTSSAAEVRNHGPVPYATVQASIGERAAPPIPVSDLRSPCAARCHDLRKLRREIRARQVDRGRAGLPQPHGDPRDGARGLERGDDAGQADSEGAEQTGLEVRR